MTVTYAEVMRQASGILQDEGAVRWTALELYDWINLALADIFALKPNAKTQVATLTLAAGVQQTLDLQYALVLQFRRNGGGGRAVRMLDNLATLDNWSPDWTDPTKLPNAAVIQYVYQDPLTPRQFYVIPGATTAATLEAVVAVAPTPGAKPVAADQIDPTKYTAAIDLPDAYRTAVLHFALARAFSKDGDNAAGANQAQAHRAMAVEAINSITAGEAAMSAGARTRKTAG